MISLKDFAAAFRAHRNLLIFAACYSVIVMMIGFREGAQPREFGYLFHIFMGTPLLFSLFAPMLMLNVYSLRALDEIAMGEHSRENAVARLRVSANAYFKGSHLAHGIVGSLAVFPVMMFFCAAKSLIPALATYQFDPLLAHIDYLVHGGHYSYEFFLVLFRNNFVYHTIDTLYSVYWFVGLYLAVSYAIWVDPNQHRRMRFLWCFCLGWVVVGNILATLFASVGPLFYAQFYPDLTSPYDVLMNRIHWQDGVRSLHVTTDIGFFQRLIADKTSVIKLNALSSMPSMHIAIASLTCFYLWGVNRTWRWLGVSYFLLMFVGSVALGWHYAIDGYVSTIIMAGFWWGMPLLMGSKHLPADDDAG